MVLDQRSDRNVPDLAAQLAKAIPHCTTLDRVEVHPLPDIAQSLGAHPARLAAPRFGKFIRDIANMFCHPTPAPAGQPAGAPCFLRRATPSECGDGHGGSAGVGVSVRGKTTQPCHGTRKEREGAMPHRMRRLRGRSALGVLRVSGWVVLMGMAVSVGANQITPMNIDTPGGFGPWRVPPSPCTVVFEDRISNVQAIQCPVRVPPGSVEIAGWGGYTIDLSLLVGGHLDYMTIEFWHNGGTPHRLDQPHAWTPGSTIGPVFYPAGDGHKCSEGDLVFGILWCNGFAGQPPPLCAGSVTFHFRLGP